MAEQQLRFGIIRLPNFPWTALVENWRLFEELGFDSVWDCDHFINPFNPPEPWYEGWTCLAGLAASTERIRVGMLVTCITFRNPVLFARGALTVDHTSNGRLELGLGAGYDDLEHRMMGISFPPAAERVARFREVVEIVDRLLRDGETTYHGRYYRANEAIMHPAPLQRPRPPLTLGVFGPKMLRIVAEYADSWNVSGTVEKLREASQILDEHCVEIGRDPALAARRPPGGEGHGERSGVLCGNPVTSYRTWSGATGSLGSRNSSSTHHARPGSLRDWSISL